VKAYNDNLPVFTRFGIESQLDAMFQPVVQLRSGGYIVINQAEALVAIDVNSGRATREHHIEDTALKTNTEAAEEIARQLRLRDLAGLIVIDFIDMDEKRNNRAVERRLKECLKHDRARIQVGHISHFGLLEMSRQRIRSSVLESSTEKCEHCGGTGHMRSVSSVALQLLRALDEMLLKGATHNLIVRTRTDIALYLLNHKRAHLRALEERFQIAIMVNADATISGQTSYVLERGELVHSLEQAKAIAAAQPASIASSDYEEEEPVEEEIEEDEAADEPEPDAEDADEAAAALETAHAETPRTDDEGPRRRRRRRGRRGEGRESTSEAVAEQAGANPEGAEDLPSEEAEPSEAGADATDTSGQARGDAEHRRRRRGRRGGRRNRRDRDGEAPQSGSDAVAGFEAGLSVPESDARAYVEPLLEQREAEAMQQRDDVRSEEHEAKVQHDEQPPRSAEPPAPEPQEPAPSRRRSTVREPAPASFSSESAMPSPAPAYVAPVEPPPAVLSGSSEAEVSDQPRRSGWWNRKVLGKD
jgi:ribonuclease E